MWVKRNINTVQTSNPTGITIGAFDGVHLGHQALISWMIAEAHHNNLEAVVLTFDPLPRQVFKQQENGLLANLEERLSFLEKLEPEGVIVTPFNRKVAATAAEDFIKILVENLQMRGVWIGPDFKLGRGGEGTPAHLRELGQRYDFTVATFNDVILWHDEPVRSSRIRKALRAGRLDEANGCLGRPYRITGLVTHGDKRGRSLGFPTANLAISEKRLLPADGVYICQVQLKRGIFNAITNVGTRPTFNNRPPTVEAHLLDFSGNIYGEHIQVDFLHRLRPELKFDSAEALIEQMGQDANHARLWLATRMVDSENTDDKNFNPLPLACMEEPGVI
ncbi:MAG: bifunctional riboflavin kinase/FAD synthetase [Anaerolineae bacterium]|nr:bifunctional riboflavin kinase/FAD synthetase [Anaerolineae bacterium]